jgi:conjugative transfer signal peptidase TraF
MTLPISATSSGSARPARSPRGGDRRHPCSGLSWRVRFRARPALVAIAVAAVVAGGTAFTASRLTRNYTASLPLGVYCLRPGLPVSKGEIVDLAIPPPARPLIVGRYLPSGFRLLKRVVALEGDVVCLTGRWYQVNGVAISSIATVDSMGRPLAAFHFCGPVPAGMAFVATPVPSSLDSRYFGPVPLRALTVARFLWTS